MHKLGDTVTTEEEEEKFRRIKEKIRSILTARRNLYNAGVELLECDRVYAEGIKAELERHIFVSHTVPFVGAGAIKKPIDEADVRFYLEMRLHIYVKEDNITIDTDNGLCKIRLNDKLTANIPIESGTAVKSIEAFR